MFPSFHPGSIHLWVAVLSVSSPTCGRLSLTLSTNSQKLHRSFSSSLVPRHSPSLCLSYFGKWTCAFCRIIILVFTVLYLILNIVLLSFTVHFMMYNHGSFLLGSVVMCYVVSLASVYGKSVDLLRAQLKLVSCLHLPIWYSKDLHGLEYWQYVGWPMWYSQALSFTNSILVLQEGRDKQFLVRQIEQLSRQLLIPKHTAGAEDWTQHVDHV